MRYCEGLGTRSESRRGFRELVEPAEEGGVMGWDQVSESEELRGTGGPCRGWERGTCEGLGTRSVSRRNLGGLVEGREGGRCEEQETQLNVGRASHIYSHLRCHILCIASVLFTELFTSYTSVLFYTIVAQLFVKLFAI